MGFFKDFKRDFAQAVNELMPDKNELANEYDDEDMVNTFDDIDDIDIAPEDILEDLDDYTIDDRNNGQRIDEDERQEIDFEDDFLEEGEEPVSSISDAEIITETEDNRMEDESVLSDEKNSGGAEEENLAAQFFATFGAPAQEEDELKDVDELDEENMLEGTEDALMVEAETEADAEEETAPEANTDAEEEIAPEAKADAEDIAPEAEVAPAADTDAGESTTSEKETDTEVADSEESVEGLKESQDEIQDLAQGSDESTNQEEEETIEQKQEEEPMAENETKQDEIELSENGQDVESLLESDTTYITKGTTIRGNIETDGGIDIIGAVEGDVICHGKLIVGGNIKGCVKAGEVYANAAKIEGEINSEGSVKIGMGTVVVGNVIATSAVIAGAINGDIDVQGPVIVDSTAVIMGNIKSRSVQINNGAVIEGFCSQCYSEIDVKSFFE